MYKTFSVGSLAKSDLLFHLSLLLLHQAEKVEHVRSKEVILFEEDEVAVQLFCRLQNVKDLVRLPPPVVLRLRYL